MIIDAHHHLLTAPDYTAKLMDACARWQIDKVCLFGAGRVSPHYGVAGNPEVRRASERHPNTIIGFATIDLGVDPPGVVDEYVRQGFKGVKFINPKANYDDRSFYPLYARIEEHRLPALFHLGIVTRTPMDHQQDINNDRHRPVYLDTLARAFPGMTLIGAHLGNPWYEEAAMACRWNPNLYFDLTGSTLKCKSARFLGDLLWWTPTTRYRDPLKRHAWEKIVFGSDVGADEIGDVLNDYRAVMNALGLSTELQDKVFGGTMARLLELGT